MSQILDRRLNGKNKSAINRQRFIRRYKSHIKKAVSDAISKRSIENMEQGERITIPARDISEPIFHHGQGGINESIHPGNKEFATGDKIKRPPQSAQGGSGDGDASDQGEGEDDFTFELSREEFLDLYFEDLELPDLVKKHIAQIPNYKIVRAGFTTAGVPTNINVVRSMKQALARRMSLAAPYKRKLKQAEISLADLENAQNDNSETRLELEEQIALYKRKINAVPFIDDIDIRYNNKIKQQFPTTQAVMFCLMDVSGSMDELKKDIAKRFFILLYLFLTKNYQKIELVFIRHHTSAKEVDEQEFFYSRETGGTVVSSALTLMDEIIKARYPSNEWNIYAAQASDGDNWNADSPYCQKILSEKIMPFVQYFAYTEIMPRHHQSLWECYQNVQGLYENFAMQTINEINEIYPVFRELFKRQSA